MAEGEKISKTRVQWRIDWDAFREGRAADHPVFDLLTPREAWEFVRLIQVVLNREAKHLLVRQGELDDEDARG